MNKKHPMKVSAGDRVFAGAITVFMTAYGLIALVPLLTELALSLSSKAAADTNSVMLLPVGFTLDSWKYMISQATLWRSVWLSVSSMVIGVIIALVINVLMAYPLSKKEFKPAKFLMLFVVFTMIFKAPTVPYYLTIKSLKLINNYWVLVLPQVLSAYNLIVMRSFFAAFPHEIEEAAEIDGCGKFQTLLSIVVPSSKPVLATVGLFYGVASWNQYQTPLMFIQKTELFPLQLKINQLIKAGGDLLAITKVANVNYTTATLGAVAIIFAIIPVLLVYPFLQKYFAQGAMIGSVKG